MDIVDASANPRCGEGPSSMEVTQGLEGINLLIYLEKLTLQRLLSCP